MDAIVDEEVETTSSVGDDYKHVTCMICWPDPDEVPAVALCGFIFTERSNNPDDNIYNGHEVMNVPKTCGLCIMSMDSHLEIHDDLGDI